MNIPSQFPVSSFTPARAAAATQAPAEAPPQAPADGFTPSTPSFAAEPLAALRSGQVPEGLTSTPLTPADQQEAGKAVFAASFLSSIDEKPGQDGAMGQPGVVVSNGLTCEFQSAGEKQIEALIYGPGKTGEPSAMYVNSGPNGLNVFGFLDKGDQVEVRGQVVTPNADGTLGGYAVSGFVADHS